MIDKRKGENRRNEAISTALGGGYLSKKKRWANRLKRSQNKVDVRIECLKPSDHNGTFNYLYVQWSTSYLKY